MKTRKRPCIQEEETKARRASTGTSRVPKDSPRVDAYGTIDELNSCIGLAVAECKHAEIARPLKKVQASLFTAGADLATELGQKGRSVPRIQSKDTVDLEKMVDELQGKLPKLTSFILPGGSRLSATLHVARSLCRRAERRVVTLARSEKINPELVPYLNRLSTYLFNLARYANLLDGVKDEVWRP